MSRSLELVSAKYIGNYNDNTIYEGTIKLYNDLVNIDIIKYSNGMNENNSIWYIKTDSGITPAEKKAIIKIVSNNTPIHFIEAEEKVYNQKIYTEEEIKTLKGWTDSRADITSYLKVGDIVNKELVDDIINSLPPITLNGLLVQMGEPYSSDQHGRNTYITFGKDTPFGNWHFKGICIKDSTKNIDNSIETIISEKELEVEKKDENMEKLWCELENVPFSEKDGVEILDGPFLDFEQGKTTKEDIWHWFDQNYSKGVHYLLYCYEIDKSITDVEEENAEEEI